MTRPSFYPAIVRDRPQFGRCGLHVGAQNGMANQNCVICRILVQVGRRRLSRVGLRIQAAGIAFSGERFAGMEASEHHSEQSVSATCCRCEIARVHLAGIDMFIFVIQSICSSGRERISANYDISTKIFSEICEKANAL
jgi:hypothetical protein